VLNNFNVACGNITPDLLRPFPGYSNIALVMHGADSSYNALQALVRGRISGVDLSAAYTWSHSLDNSSDRYDGSFVNGYDFKSNWASSNFDETHVLNASWVWTLPFFGNNGLAGGWQWSGIASFQTGTPFSVYPNGTGDVAGVGNGVGTGSYVDYVGGSTAQQSPQFIGQPGPLLYNPGTLANPVFSDPRGLTFGNTGRNFMRNPGLMRFDMGVFKDFKLTERQSIQFRAEGFNVFNHVNWSGIGNSLIQLNPDGTCAANCNFLTATGAHEARVIQFGLKWLF
jgi:hypothetical protein